MICCENCFLDSEIKATIVSLGNRGQCPLCHANDVFVYDSDRDYENSDFEELLTSVIEIYKPSDCLTDKAPVESRKFLEEHLADDWNIFNKEAIGIEGIQKIATSIILNSPSLDKKLLYHKCAIPELFDDQYMYDNSIIHNNTWDDFKHSLKEENRFHSHSIINLDLLGAYLKVTESKLSAKDQFFYRARLAQDASGIEKKYMGAPPRYLASAGRVNSKGVSCLYLADKEETTVKEIRAGAFDYVTIGTFILNKDMNVLDLSTITHNSPFFEKTNKVNFLINEKHLRDIANDISKPISSHDSELEYLPTEYISDYVKYLGYDGVKYISTFDPQSYDVALFDIDACECVEATTYRIENLNYGWTKVE